MHPRIAEAIKWESPSGVKSWHAWDNKDRSELSKYYQTACEHYSASISPPWDEFDIIPNEKNLGDFDYAKTVYSSGNARKIYLQTVAQSLALEVSKKIIRWTVENYSTNSLEILFDSRHFFGWEPDEQGYVLNMERNGLISFSSPVSIIKFLRENNLIAPTSRLTLVRFLRWSTKLEHDILTQQAFADGLKREKALFLQKFWHFRGFPPVMRVLNGTVQSLSKEYSNLKHHWTAGCWGTTGLFKAVLRTINISVEVKKLLGHSAPMFVSDSVFLSHGDDPYDEFVTTYQTPPVEALLIPERAWQNFFNQPDPVLLKNIGYMPAKIALESPNFPDIVTEAHCGKLGKSTNVFDLFKDKYHLFDLIHRYRVWQRLRGVCGTPP